MVNVKQIVSTALMNEGLKYIEKDPMANLPKLVDWAGKIVTLDNHKKHVETFRKIVNDPTSNWYKLIERFLMSCRPVPERNF